MARKKMSAANKSKVGAVMRAARKRKPSGRKVKFTPAEKSTLREVMTSHHGGKSAAKKKAAPAKKRAAPKRKASMTRTKRGYEDKSYRKRGALTTKGKRGRKKGFKHSAATRAKMSKSHKARHAGRKTAASKRFKRASKSKW